MSSDIEIKVDRLKKSISSGFRVVGERRVFAFLVMMSGREAAAVAAAAASMQGVDRTKTVLG